VNCASSFGLAVIELGPDSDAHPDHDHASAGQEEVYVVLRGSGELEIDGETIALDPSIDLIAHRLPHAVLDVNDPPEAEARIARTAAALGPRGALLLFPEGGNFTPERRRQALRSLRRKGKRAAASAGARMQHLLPPRPSGTCIALRANPDADVVFAAHTGLGLAAYPLEIWRDLPVGRTLRTRMWFVPRAEIPDGEDEIATWLNEWWTRIDDWIGAHGDER